MLYSNRVAVSKTVRKKLFNAFKQSDLQFEVGGVLLGYRLFNYWIVIDATVPVSTEQKKHFEFTLDGAEAEKAAALLIHRYWPPLSFIGVWHSHPGMNDVFSKQDRESNLQLACSSNGTLSALISEDEKRDSKIDFYHIAADCY